MFINQLNFTNKLIRYKFKLDPYFTNNFKTYFKLIFLNG